MVVDFAVSLKKNESMTSIFKLNAVAKSVY